MLLMEQQSVLSVMQFFPLTATVIKNDIEALCIVTFAKKVGSPCGICRQVLCELLHQDTPIILANENEVIITDIAELLPMQFTEEDLK